MRPSPRTILWLLLLLPIITLAQNLQFSADSAYAHVEYLTETIGSRTMGSANEHRALQWARDKFKTYGADTAYIMPVPKAPQGINTTSGVAVGIFPGESDSIIVIGAHIDSDRRDNPGASDNASGTACIIELARIRSAEPRHYTLLFAAFGGEEGGLVGSKYFADHYLDINKVALMLNIDMAGSEGWLIPFIDLETHQSPRWLVEDSYAIDRSLGYNSLEYPTHFFSLNGILGGAGSDHMPFMKKGIPAIDFTSGINIDPIHTPQDRLDFLSKPMLARSGRLVNALISKYQEQGIPPERKGHYMLWEIFGGQLFIPNWLILTFDVLALFLGIIALLQTRKMRFKIDRSERARLSGFKLFVLMLIIAIFTQLGEAGMQLIKGLRYPWLTHVEEYLWLAAICALAGIWAAVWLTKSWRFSPDPYTYAKRGIVWLIIFMVALGASGSPRLALYPALTLFMFALVINIPNSTLKIALTIIAPLPLFRLIFMETLPLFARTSTLAGFVLTDFMRSFLYSAALTLILAIWFLPVIYIFAYTLSGVPLSRKLAGLYRKPITGLLILLMIAGYGGYLYSLPAYSPKWQAQVLVEAEYDIRKAENKLSVKSNEYLRKVSVTSDTLNRQYDERIIRDELPLDFRADWLKITGDQTVFKGEKDTIALDWKIISERPWYRVNLILSVDTLKIDSIVSDLNYLHEEGKAGFRWSTEPPDTLAVSARLIVPPGTQLIREIEGQYPEIPLPINAAAEYGNIVYRTTVTYRDTLSLAAEE